MLATNLTWLVISPLLGYISDVLKMRKTLIAIVLFLLAILAYPITALFATGSYALGILAGIILGFLFIFQYSVLPPWLSENIATRVRYSYIVFTINLGVTYHHLHHT